MEKIIELTKKEIELGMQKLTRQQPYYRTVSGPLHTRYLVERQVITPFVCRVNWPCHCGHRHGRYSLNNRYKDMRGKLKGMCPKCECRWYEAMSNFEYIKWKQENK